MRQAKFACALAAIVMAAGISAQTTAPAPPPNSDQHTPADRQAYETAYREAYRARFIESCTAKGPEAGRDLTPTCTCAADTFLREKTVDELEALSKDTSDPYYGDVAHRCVQSNPPLTLPKS